MDHLTVRQITAIFDFTDAASPAEIYDSHGSYSSTTGQRDVSTNSLLIRHRLPGSSDQDIRSAGSGFLRSNLISDQTVPITPGWSSLSPLAMAPTRKQSLTAAAMMNTKSTTPKATLKETALSTNAPAATSATATLTEYMSQIRTTTSEGRRVRLFGCSYWLSVATSGGSNLCPAFFLIWN